MRLQLYDSEKKSEKIIADGVIYAVLADSEDELVTMQKKLPQITAKYNRFIFVLTKQ